MGPAFRRFGATFGMVVALLGAACSDPPDALADPAPADAVEEQGDAASADPELPSPEAGDEGDVAVPDEAPSDESSIVRRPPASVAALAELTGQIAYIDADGSVVVSAPDGTAASTLSNDDPAQRAQPTWSNDGSQLAWSSLGPTGATVTVANADGSSRSQIPAPTPAFFLAWSPDDMRVAALGPNPQGVELFFANRDTNAATRVGIGQPFFIDWADETSIVAAISASILAEVAADAEANVEVELPAPLGTFQAPAVLGPEQTLLALSNGTGGNNVVVVDGGDVTAVAQAPGPVTFSPNPVNTTVAVTVNANTSESQVISFQPDAAPTLPPNRVSIVDTAIDSEEVVTLDVEGVLATQWSPDGNTLGLLVTDGAMLEWRFFRDGQVLPGDPFAPSAEFFRSYVPFADQYERSSTWWSPDSRAVVFAGSIEGVSGIWVDLVDDDRGAVRVAGGTIAFWSPAS